MKTNKRTRRVRIAKLLLPAILLACSTPRTNAQDFVKTYYAHDNMKQYAVLPVPDKPDYVMAGTFENKYVHFVHTDAAGNVLVSRTYQEISASSEEHAVNIIAIDAETYMIVCLRRDASIGSGSYDKIKVYTVDAGGNVLDAQTIGSTTVGMSNYSNVYPTHSIYDNGILYICGFVSNQNINDPYIPNFRGAQTKKAFVMRYDPVTLTATTKTYDNTYAITPAGPEAYDFDMAMKMKMLSNGKLYVTGSCNVIQAPTSTSPTYFLNCGTLNLELDPLTLAIQNTNTPTTINTAFTTEPFSPPYLYGEYGVDIIEDPASGGYFVVGNNADYSKVAMAVDPHNLQFTYINSNFQPQGIKSRMRVHGIEGGWGLGSMESEYGTGHALIGGMQTDYFPGCTYNNPPPSRDNFNPFLADVSLQWNTGPMPYMSGTINDWKIYQTHFSTGHMSLANSYYQYGGYVTYNGWNPVFASRRPMGNILGDDDIIMTAPAWNQSSQLLSLKLLRTDPYGDIPECSESYMTCVPGIEPINVVHLKSDTGTFFTVTLNVTEDTLGMTVAAAPSNANNFHFDEVIDCEQSGGNYFRTVPTSITAVNEAQNIETTLLPNPASDYVQVSLKGNTNTDAAVKIELTDITGKLLATLYDGKAGNITAQSHLTLPSVATGMYLVKISVDKQVMPVQKLVINSVK